VGFLAMDLDSETEQPSRDYHPVGSDQWFHTYHWQISKVRHRGHFSQTVLPKAVAHGQWMALKTAAERNDSLQTRMQVGLRMDGMDFRLSHLEVDGLVEKLLKIDDDHPYHISELNFT
jgi:hypothetical protein